MADNRIQRVTGTRAVPVSPKEKYSHRTCGLCGVTFGIGGRTSQEKYCVDCREEAKYLGWT